MRTVGLYLKEARLKKKLSLKQMEKETKIKKDFINSIEKGEWSSLPEYFVTLGFVKTLAKYLNVSEENATAIFRRDYPTDARNLFVNPKPDLKVRSFMNPKVFMVVASVFIGILFLGYLAYQYYLYISPPKLVVFSPTENQEVYENELSVIGKTQDDATLKVNNQQVLVTESGDFVDKIEVDENTKQVVFIARSRYGKETVVIRKIVPKLD